MDKRKKLLEFLGSTVIQTGCQFILGGIFIYASLGKIFYPMDFVSSIKNFRILPEFLVSATGYTLPWLELIFGVLLVMNVFKKLSAAVLSGLLVVFIIAIGSTLLRGIDIDCGCFYRSVLQASEAKSNGFLLILRDIFFLVPGTVILQFPSNHKNKK